jgi:hypothetical protein
MIVRTRSGNDNQLYFRNITRWVITINRSGMIQRCVSDDPVELGVQLLERLEHAELSIAETIDRIETITTHPATTRSILEEAEARGVIEREGTTVKPTGGRFLRFESEVVVKEGEFTCRRCGASLSSGHFMRLEDGDHGPFGSTCIRKVTGRE